MTTRIKLILEGGELNLLRKYHKCLEQSLLGNMPVKNPCNGYIGDYLGGWYTKELTENSVFRSKLTWDTGNLHKGFAAQVSWDGNNQLIRIQFDNEVGALDVTVYDSEGNILHKGILDTGKLKHVISLSQATTGDYTLLLTDEQGSTTSLVFTVA